MNKKVIVENLEQLIEEHKKEKIPYKTYTFDSNSYTLLLCDINQLKRQLEEKDKVIDEILNECFYVCDCPLSRLDEDNDRLMSLLNCENCQDDYKKCWLKYFKNEVSSNNNK